jgi:hypothetical protein
MLGVASPGNRGRQQKVQRKVSGCAVGEAAARWRACGGSGILERKGGEGRGGEGLN